MTSQDVEKVLSATTDQICLKIVDTMWKKYSPERLEAFLRAFGEKVGERLTGKEVNVEGAIVPTNHQTILLQTLNALGIVCRLRHPSHEWATQYAPLITNNLIQHLASASLQNNIEFLRMLFFALNRLYESFAMYLTTITSQLLNQLLSHISVFVTHPNEHLCAQSYVDLLRMILTTSFSQAQIHLPSLFQYFFHYLSFYPTEVRSTDIPLILSIVELLAQCIQFQALLPATYNSSTLLCPKEWPFSDEEDEDEIMVERFSYYGDALVTNPCICDSTQSSSSCDSPFIIVDPSHLSSTLLKMILWMQQGDEKLLNNTFQHEPTYLLQKEMRTIIYSFIPSLVAFSNYLSNTRNPKDFAFHHACVAIVFSYLHSRWQIFTIPTHSSSPPPLPSIEEINELSRLCSSTLQYSTSLLTFNNGGFSTLISAFPSLPKEIVTLRALHDQFVKFIECCQSRVQRAYFVKLRRTAVITYTAFLYSFSKSFEQYIGFGTFTSRIFPLLASPALVPHFIYIYRNSSDNYNSTESNVQLQSVASTLLPSLLRSSNRSATLSISAIQVILHSIGASTNHLSEGNGKCPLFSPYLQDAMGALLATLEESPLTLGVASVVNICRFMVSCYAERNFDGLINEVLRAFISIMDESIFNAKGDEDDSDADVDTCSQLQICLYDCLTSCLSTPAFDQLIADNSSSSNSETRQLWAQMLQISIGNMTKPVIFEEDSTIRNREVYWLTSVIQHSSSLYLPFVVPGDILSSMLTAWMEAREEQWMLRHCAFEHAFRSIYESFHKLPKIGESATTWLSNWRLAHPDECILLKIDQL